MRSRVWGGASLLVALANLIWPNYGRVFLEVVASVYPGYRLSPGINSVIIATLYGLLGGLIVGFVFVLGWLYNFLSRWLIGPAA